MAFFALHPTDPLRLLSVTELALERERLLSEVAHLQRAVTSHEVTDQAKGAVAALGRMSPDDAWTVLRQVSQNTNTKLTDVARHILDFVQGGTLPEDERRELYAAISQSTSAQP
ncbi:MULTISPECIES: ANTAR domain-containing protein [unclassified Streptomyces]|uniref:ANTAR domain-containing protein n=1 Tax=unclassified Streptomyces TaxID=2593676 RepID=UPI000DB93E9E|nr:MULTISPECIES: ANTAR domain-containing protein [unclassified Streptomyces]MYT72457.1 ANTAR domain-containing protein [Streptomyces sp. SID8367]RAJ70602.1 ANTAR domain-containing protein [Streptomyces sp. PsTaAH-137]